MLETTYKDQIDVKLARPKRRRGAVLLSKGRASELRSQLSGLRGGALIRMCVVHGDNPLIRAIRKRNTQLVAIIASQCSSYALNAEVGPGSDLALAGNTLPDFSPSSSIRRPRALLT